MLTGLVLVWLVAVCWGRQGYDLNDQWNRLSWGWAGLGGLLVLALLQRERWALAAGLAWIMWTLMVTTPLHGKIPRSQAWSQTGTVVLALGAGVAAWPSGLIDRSMVLGALALMGLPVTAWAWYTWQHPTGRYQHVWRGTWWLYDESNVCPRAGQGNANHAATMLVLSAAAACGLVVIQSAWWGLVLPIDAGGIWLCRDHRSSWLTQAMVQLAAVMLVTGCWEVWR